MPIKLPATRARRIIAAGAFVSLLTAGLSFAVGAGAEDAEPAKTAQAEETRLRKPSGALTHLSKESATCASCHKEKNPGIYQQWGRSKHYRGNIGCYECHQAAKGDPDAIYADGDRPRASA